MKQFTGPVRGLLFFDPDYLGYGFYVKCNNCGAISRSNTLIHNIGCAECKNGNGEKNLSLFCGCFGAGSLQTNIEVNIDEKNRLMFKNGQMIFLIDSLNIICL